jgi:H+-transporting ATPase
MNNGLSTAEVEKLRDQYGLNQLPVKKKSFIKKLLRWIVSPVSLMLIAAAVLSLFDGSVVDFWIIIVLFLSNFLITVWHEAKADKSIEKLEENLKFKIKTMRDGEWVMVDTTMLVPGDIISLKIGAVVPADVTIVDEVNLSINESVLTGESLPQTKAVGDLAYSGSFVATGRGTGKVTAIGANTNFGKTVTSVDKTVRRSALEKDILSISRFISIIALIVVVILTFVLLATHAPFTDILTLDLSLLIAGIPVALPTVMSLIISIGVVELAKKHVIVRRLASLEDLANVNMLLSDKTGTLTQNKIVVEKTKTFGTYTEHDLVAIGSSALTDTEHDPLDHAVSAKAEELGIKPYEQLSAIPADSERKRNTAIIRFNGEERAVSIGAAQVIVSLCNLDESQKKEVEKSVNDAADEGYRAHAVAISKTGTEEKGMDFVGIMLLADKVHEDAADTIKFMNERGISVKMLTGDNFEISKRVAASLGIKGDMYRRNTLDTEQEWLSNNFDKVAGFSEVLPKDKYDIVKIAQKHYTAAVTGDGVNDLPAVKTADVGFAVSHAVDALKSTADIVLIENGISVIKDAIIEARKIFIRLYNYSLYRISESFRIIITIAVIGLIYKTYPLTPVQLIILAFLNDVPIITFAFDKVKAMVQPAHINAKARFTLSTLFGLTGIANSLTLLFIMTNFLHLPWDIIQTAFFLKLTVSGHMLVYVAHTEEKWWRFLPSKQVIIATIGTQIIATLLAFFGMFITPIPLGLIALVWVWSFIWMQVAEMMKGLQKKIL